MIGLPKEKLGLVGLWELGDEIPDRGLVTSLCITLDLDYEEMCRLIARSDVEEMVDDEKLLSRVH